MSPPRRAIRAPNPFAESYNLIRSLRDAPPLSSCYEEDRRDSNVITIDLDETQSRQMSTEPRSQWLWILRRPRVASRCAAALGHVRV
ncbi:hypothetical protein PC129_g13217 [Phytophthora cactorum]|nr:hypothetical protein PC114_g16298 [Phytophthora cactorum]KAG3003860.1 hypothetical protein PC119_g15812 [Phytophthora cactorum]KAG3184664.1 hypothetical protein C6341_g4878 [Phytophthora cactorum]KAG3215919.1 hypothetical protein PC129_g13217 [Phytophthora cactorum]KAG4246603.1 hypothetical protein PC116_g5571 [Phytophthora cactorum]